MTCPLRGPNAARPEVEAERVAAGPVAREWMTCPLVNSAWRTVLLGLVARVK